ncbi:hypothetical protein NLI96_g6796 [Meripilus lineatus]|uniref:Uncharacterized protein n=1 Tax=Meripilus lineatus TaxID=2056292 RepID=A0AAD5V217_9APHY|nr:hypothetical protein NLI96_g6796 [Physisporinus lineatus]
MPPKTTAGVSTRPRNAEMHPGTPDIPTPRRSSAEVAAEKARKETELEQLRANHAATLLRIAELEAEGKAKVKQVNQPSTVALNTRKLTRAQAKGQNVRASGSSSTSNDVAQNTPEINDRARKRKTGPSRADVEAVNLLAQDATLNLPNLMEEPMSGTGKRRRKEKDISSDRVEHLEKLPSVPLRVSKNSKGSHSKPAGIRAGWTIQAPEMANPVSHILPTVASDNRVQQISNDSIQLEGNDRLTSGGSLVPGSGIPGVTGRITSSYGGFVLSDSEEEDIESMELAEVVNISAKENHNSVQRQTVEGIVRIKVEPGIPSTADSPESPSQSKSPKKKNYTNADLGYTREQLVGWKACLREIIEIAGTQHENIFPSSNLIFWPRTFARVWEKHVGKPFGLPTPPIEPGTPVYALAFQRLYEWVSGFFICAKGQADFYWDFHGCKSSDTRKDIINELSCKETGLPFISKKTTLLEDGTFDREGRYCGPWVSRVLSYHLSSINKRASELDEYPVGALCLSVLALEHLFRLYKTGSRIATVIVEGREKKLVFNEANYLLEVQDYLHSTSKLSEDDWKMILDSAEQMRVLKNRPFWAVDDDEDGNVSEDPVMAARYLRAGI